MNTSSPFRSAPNLEKAESISEITDADKVLDRLVERSKRKKGLRLPSTFATNKMLCRFVQGGRGGEIRLKLYLSMVLLAGSEHEHAKHGKHKITDVASGAWADALNLKPSQTRRVTDAQNWMEENKLIRLERKGGKPPHITLLNSNGSSQPWTSPTSPYISVPREIWTNRWIWKLRCKELAVLISIIDLCKGNDQFAFLSGSKKDYYGLSTDTWRLAAKELEERHGLIQTRVEVMAHDLGSKRSRKGYRMTDLLKGG